MSSTTADPLVYTVGEIVRSWPPSLGRSGVGAEREAVLRLSSSGQSAVPAQQLPELSPTLDVVLPPLLAELVLQS